MEKIASGLQKGIEISIYFQRERNYFQSLSCSAWDTS